MLRIYSLTLEFYSLDRYSDALRTWGRPLARHGTHLPPKFSMACHMPEISSSRDFLCCCTPRADDAPPPATAPVCTLCILVLFSFLFWLIFPLFLSVYSSSFFLFFFGSFFPLFLSIFASHHLHWIISGCARRAPKKCRASACPRTTTATRRSMA